MRPICRWLILGQDTHLEGTLMSRTVRCEEYVPMKKLSAVLEACAPSDGTTLALRFRRVWQEPFM